MGFYCMMPFQLIFLLIAVTLANQAIGEENNKANEIKNNFTCKGNSSFSHTTNSSGCECLPGYQGNPYQPNGCQDIDECQISNPCENGTCVNQPGGWSCICPIGFVRTENGCTNLGVNHHSRRRFLGYMAPAGLSIFLMGGCYAGIYWSVKKRGFLNQKKRFFEQNGGIMLEELSNLQTAKIFNEKEIKIATNNFNEDRVVGEESYGKVYKGILPNGQVAVKEYKFGNRAHREEFVNEVVVLSQTHHRNVVELLGCCLETEIPLIVYEFVPNGTLFNHIHEIGKACVLPWNLRLKIATETAGALAYLHSEARKLIVHGDVKTANILLDENYTAKLSGFGLSKIFPENQDQITELVRGTLGYLDPEYFRTGQLTEKCDVYSFGVVLAELLTSKKVISSDSPEGELHLATFFVSAVEEDRLHDVLDGDIAWDEENVEQAKKVASLAKMCLRPFGKERPTMKDVAVELHILI